ncbi:MAG TPA: type II and III secretion system protein, partial [Aquificaceae bacterium]|nr:type II and III secretion system protein [Aquificaceae bacterium]
VITINGQEAVIKQGTEIPFQTTVVAGGAAAANIQFKEAVLELKVLPIISPDGRVMLDISLKQDTPGVQTPQGPAINTKQVTTKVIVNDGDTLVIGGIIDSLKNRTTEGVAGLVRVPILKWLFGQERIQDQDVELLIFITPTIIMD